MGRESSILTYLKCPGSLYILVECINKAISHLLSSASFGVVCINVMPIENDFLKICIYVGQLESQKHRIIQDVRRSSLQHPAQSRALMFY